MKTAGKKTAGLILVLGITISMVNAQPSGILNASNANTPDVLYIGIENEIRVSVEGTPFEELQIDVDFGIIKKVSSNFYVRVGKSDTIKSTQVSLYSIVNGNRREFLSKNFKIIPLPDPEIDLPGINAGKISQASLVSQKGISLILKDFNIKKQPFTIVRFSIILSKSGKSITATSSTGRLTTEQVTAISENGITGTKLRIDDLYVVGPDFILRKLKAIDLVIQ